MGALRVILGLRVFLMISSLDMLPKINLLLPMNGDGARFREEGYTAPKPLVPVLGKPMVFWLLDNLRLEGVDQVIVPYARALDAHFFQTRLRDRYPDAHFVFLPISQPTRGAADTARLALGQLPDESLDLPFLLLDCDTFYFQDIVGLYRAQPRKNHIFYFKDAQSLPLYSYIKLKEGRVSRIAEKQRISDMANCGAYGFESGRLLKETCEALLDAEPTTQEVYISHVYRAMLESHWVGATPVEDFHCVGTPLQLKIFCEHHCNNHADSRKRRFCFDLDSTLVTKPRVPGDYATCEPIQKHIDIARFLKSQGHHIIVFTARRMRTHQGNLSAVIRDIGKLTLEQLDRFEIPYDEVQFGKPWADFYIDDLAVNAFQDIEKQIGYYNTTVQSRAFNRVEILQNMVVKSGKIEGERYYYQTIQRYAHLAPLFPRLLDASEKSLVIERVQGVTLSHLHTNACLEVPQLQALLEALGRLHGEKAASSAGLFGKLPVPTALHNVEKLLERYADYDYSAFPGADDLLERLVDFLRGYRQADTTVIHGDPVLTNVLIGADRSIQMIDMRGISGGSLTIFGDPIYDLAKVYQSLTGYDHILGGKEPCRDEGLLRFFEEWVAARYPFTMREVSLFAASLYFTLIPLHDDEKCPLYYQMAQRLAS